MKRRSRSARLLLRSSFGALAWVATAPIEFAHACPDCEIGRAMRTQLWRDDFSVHLAVVLLPFALIAAASMWADRIGRRA